VVKQARFILFGNTSSTVPQQTPQDPSALTKSHPITDKIDSIFINWIATHHIFKRNSYVFYCHGQQCPNQKTYRRS